ncbi:hypothetical protein [Beijerinckia sp. L45]|uniref:hypothetical protein n=1 Tax=Beijerinckia sp. L45 TaxID=1641855 RepID=UPI00131CBEBC|nr:hypothetical protein [Beijerinckia sp. L45]
MFKQYFRTPACVSACIGASGFSAAGEATGFTACAFSASPFGGVDAAGAGASTARAGSKPSAARARMQHANSAVLFATFVFAKVRPVLCAREQNDETSLRLAGYLGMSSAAFAIEDSAAPTVARLASQRQSASLHAAACVRRKAC